MGHPKPHDGIERQEPTVGPQGSGLGYATHTDMDPRPRPGQRVRITYEAEWCCWDSIKRPVTKPPGNDTSRYIAPRNAQIEVIE